MNAQNALVDALRAGRRAGAGLDVQLAPALPSGVV
jgi:phosphoglycerate dehydrogenase-like enzyme